jgi:hypothetical protein
MISKGCTFNYVNYMKFELKFHEMKILFLTLDLKMLNFNVKT